MEEGRGKENVTSSPVEPKLTWPRWYKKRKEPETLEVIPQAPGNSKYFLEKNSHPSPQKMSSFSRLMDSKEKITTRQEEQDAKTTIDSTIRPKWF